MEPGEQAAVWSQNPESWDRTEPDLEGPGDEDPKGGRRVCCRDSQRNNLGMDTQVGSVALGHGLETMIPSWCTGALGAEVLGTPADLGGCLMLQSWRTPTVDSRRCWKP